jgi:hypothetical protein
MRRRHFSARTLLALWFVALGGARTVIAQSTSGEGAIEFLLPTGARSSGMGQAVVASAIGSEALWWNPALVAHGAREAGLHVTKILTIDTDASGAILIPVQRVGTFAFGIRYLNEGSQPAIDSTGTQTGTFTTTVSIIGATFASAITSRLALGITYKLLRFDFNSTGGAQQPANKPQTIALDLGAQYLVMSDSSIALGFALTNAGPKLQVHDASQADALPVRADFGIAIAPRLEQLPKEARVRVAADLVSRVSGGYAPGFRMGGELAWLERYQARAGYVFNGPTGSGPTFGLGFSTGKLQIDLARLLLNTLSASDSPTYLSLRYLF